MRAWRVAGVGRGAGGGERGGGLVVYWRGKKKSRGSDYKVQSLHCAITITGGRQPARYWWCAHQLSDFPTSRLVGVVAGGGGCACWGTAKP